MVLEEDAAEADSAALEALEEDGREESLSPAVRHNAQRASSEKVSKSADSAKSQNPASSGYG